MPIALATPIASDAAVVTASSESPMLPASNLLVAQPFDCWRGLTTQEYLVLDLGSSKPVRLVWLGYTNATASATWRVRGAETEAALTASPVYGSGTIPHRPTADLGTWVRNHAFLWLDAPIALRWWRIDVDNVGSADGYYEAGRIYLSSPWVPRRGIDLGFQTRNIDSSQRRRANSGTAYARQRGFWRELDFQLSYMDEEEVFKTALEIERLRGTFGDVLVMLDTESPRFFMERSLYGYLRDLGPIVNHGKAVPPEFGTLQAMYRKRYRIEEMEHP